MRKLILTVEETFFLPTIGLIFAPCIDRNKLNTDVNGTLLVDAELVLPNSDRKETRVQLSWFHFNPGGYKLICSSKTLKKEEVPPETEIWLLALEG